MLLGSTGCIENRLSVELFTQIHADGSCTRRVEYRLERVDTDKGDVRVPIPPAEDPLRNQHRFPSGEPWQVREDERGRPVHSPLATSSPPSSTPSTVSTSTRRCYGPREKRELEALYDRLDDRQKDLAARLCALAPGTPPEEIEAAADASFKSLADGLLAQLDEAGLPLVTPEGADSLRFRATLVMPAPIVRANTCVAGDTATWEFEEADLFGRGFEMKALASAR
jgi:hypothetical protein